MYRLERVMRKSFAVFVICCTAPAWAALNVPITIQEALYSGGPAGVARTNEPFCSGVPIADSAGITSTGVLALTGASAGQFRITERWPSGNAKWIKVCGILSSLSAGGTASVTLTDGGSGNFGGASMASGTSPITVATGTMTATIKAAGQFNLLDTVTVGSTPVLTSSTSPTRGLVLTGPDPTASYPGNVTCSPQTGGSTCATVYSSANDPNSSCTIEENGPVMAVLRCVGTHYDSASHPYMQYTVRETFWKNRNSVEVTSILRNANYNTSVAPSPDMSGGFNTAYKGLASYEARLGINIAGTLNYTLATNGSPQTGTLNQNGGTDTAFVYAGQTQYFNPGDCSYGSSCMNLLTPDTGWTAKKNTTTLASDTSGSTVPAGYADIADTSGVGAEIGRWFFGGYGPTSLEFATGGNEARIGLYSAKNSQNVYQSWPAWEISKLWFNFHAITPSSLADSFQAYQAPLVGRAARTYYNSTGVFLIPMPDPAQEDAYYTSIANTSNPAIALAKFCCIQNFAVPSTARQYKNWGGGGGPSLQEELRLNNLQIFLRRGMTSRYLDAANFFLLEMGRAWPHSDGASASDSTVNGWLWSSRPQFGQANGELDGTTEPGAKSANQSLNYGAQPGVWVNFDTNHPHWHGIIDWYGMTGDETVKESMLAFKSYYLDTHAYQAQSGGVGTTRAYGMEMLNSAKFAEFLAAVGDTDAAGVLAQGTNNYTNAVKPDVCVKDGSGNVYPAGCTLPTYSSYGNDSAGISRVRGMQVGNLNRNQGFCADGSGYYRSVSTFLESILVEGLLWLRRVQGKSWSDYELAGDLAYGVSRYVVDEAFTDNGSSKWQDGVASSGHYLYNGIPYLVYFDNNQACPAGTQVSQVVHFGTGYTFDGGTTVFDGGSTTYGMQGTFVPWWWIQQVNGTLSSTEARRLQLAMDNATGAQTTLSDVVDFGGYQIGGVIQGINEPTGLTLQDVSFTMTDLGSGNYRLSFTPPAGSTSLRIKWSPKAIAPSGQILGYNHFTGTFSMNPATYTAWFAANTVSEPAPTSGTAQTVTVSTGTTGLTTANFSVKVYAPSGPVGTAANLVLVSGNGQTGTAGQALGSPFTVKVTDSSGNGVSGVTVTFTVTAGGGTLTAANVSTDVSGLASSTLTLGASAGTNTVTAASGALSGSPITFSATGVAAIGPPATLTLVSGNGQTGTPGQPLATPFTVKVADAGGNAVSGVTVTFAVTAGGGSLSATTVSTNTSGLASSTLTLGSGAGINTVTATSGSLSGSPVTFNATGSSGGSTAITWVHQTPTAGWPSFNGYLAIRYDPISQKTIVYGIPQGSTSIYSTDLFFYDAPTNTFTRKNRTGDSMIDSCPANTATWPSDRHPYTQMAIDSNRNVLWLYGGANQICNGSTVDVSGTAVTWTCCGLNQFSTNGTWVGAQVTIGSANYTVASVTDATHLVLATSAGTQSGAHLSLTSQYIPASSTYNLTLGTNPQFDTWRWLSPSNSPFIGANLGMTYDPDDDVIFLFGTDGSAQSHNDWVYCPTDRNPTPGILSTKQTTAGCTAPDAWSEVPPTAWVRPEGVAGPELVYDTVTKKVIQYGGAWGDSTPRNQTWAYDVPTHTWTQKALNTTPPPLYVYNSVPGSYNPVPAMIYNPNTHHVLYHQTSGVGAPADWEYDPVKDTWTLLVTTGGGPSVVDATMAYDVANNKLITWSYNNGVPDVWQGTLSTSTTVRNPCDLNGDGVVNWSDAQVAAAQAVTPGSCGTADLIGNGQCSVFDVQRVINAIRTGTCQTGQ